MLRLRTLLPIVLVLLSAFATGAEDADRLLIDRIIAVVGEDVVMLSELRDEATKLELRLRQKGVSPMPPAGAIQKQAFDSLVLKKLQLAEAARLGIEADEETMSRAIEAIAENNHMTVAELRDALQAEGMDFDSFRRSMRDEIIIRRLRSREVTNRIQVTKSEVDSYLERSGSTDGRTAVHLLYILIAVPEGASPAQREEMRVKAADVAERLQKGADFRAIAQQVSEGQNALQGGDLGWIDVNSVPPLVQPYVAKMNKGETRGPISAGRGFHIIQLADVRYGASNIIRQTHARHILLRTNEVTSDDDARRRLEQLRERVLSGDDFETLARSNSDDTASAIKGGDLGWSTPGNLVPAFEEQMDGLQINEVSKPFKTQFGWHIVQVLERRDYDATDETRRDQARKAVRDEKDEEAQDAYLRKLRDEAYIELRFDDLAN
ncbi:MAG: peptidylprolyl isomerase [Chromatiaceae bacterium]|jgi:peptidyl-prolyl cis-trans isomerase SurA|nr:peptidylprolyl isomerase [Chromatiaceae bacterium]